MKILLHIFTIFAFTSLISCESIIEPAPKNKLARSWTTNEFIFKTDVKDFVFSRANLGLDLTFKDNGTYEYPENGTGKTLEGTWVLSNKDTRLDLVDANKTLSNFDIVELTTSKMVLAWKKIDLTKAPSKSDQPILNLYSDLLAFGNLEKDFAAAKPTFVQLHVGYLVKK